MILMLAALAMLSAAPQDDSGTAYRQRLFEEIDQGDLEKAMQHYVAVVTRTVDVHVAELRRKLEQDPAKPRFITSVRSVGYRFET